MARGKNHTEQSFEELVNERDERFVERGRYGQQLTRYLEIFDRGQLLVLIHEELFTRSAEALNRICSFLDVDDEFFQDQPWITGTVHSSSTERSIFLHRSIETVAMWMRRQRGFRQVLDFVKDLGIAQWVKQANKRERDYPEMPDELRRGLDEYYASTIHRVEQILGRRVEVWRNRTLVTPFADNTDASLGSE
jgi:hypothetical protein